MRFKVGDNVRVRKDLLNNGKYNGYFFENGYTIIEYPFSTLINQKIVITTDGNTTTAKLYEGEILIKETSARLHTDDDFDFMRGAKMALEKFGNKLDEENKKKSYLKDEDAEIFYGNIGEPTEQEAPFGERLSVGDVVELFNTRIKMNVGKRFVAKPLDYPDGCVVGVAGNTFKNGNAGAGKFAKSVVTRI